MSALRELIGRTGRTADEGDTGHADTGHADTGDRSSPSRRQIIAAGGCVGLAGVAGCLDFLPGGGGEPSPTDTPVETPSATVSGTPVPETDVVGLRYNPPDSSTGYEFFVELRAPEGRGMGATWWQVETLDREKITRKSFPEPRQGLFKTSKTVDVPDDVSAVVVRGHGRWTGYGGLVMLADVEAGTITTEKQGREPRSFEGYTFE